MKNTVFLVLFAILILGCSNDDVSPTQIIGNWKLMEAKFYSPEGESSTDYSNSNIIYNFKANGTLVVSGEEHPGYTDGTYEYFFGNDFLGGETDPKVLLVKINGSKWTYDLTQGKMTLGKSYVDGPNLIFKRN